MDDAPCRKNLCSAKTGKCAQTAVAKTFACDDGEPCTVGDACDGAGTCNAGAGVCGCKSDGDCKAFDDGDVCNGGYLCVGGACKAVGKALVCQDGAVCTADSCDKAKGCVYLPISATCTDGDACTEGDACGGGSCQPGKVAACDDASPCTDSGCDKAKGCVHLPNSATCTDGDVCTLGDACQGGACKPGGASQNCEDGNSCTSDSCDKVKGCTHSMNSDPCSDGDACTVGATCAAGVCDAKVSKPNDCNDGKGCTVDACDAVKGCVHTAAADASACAEQAHGACLAGACKATVCGIGLRPVVVDDDGNKVFACEALGPVWGRRAISPQGVYGPGSQNFVKDQTAVLDAQTGLEWNPGPSTAMNWPDAKKHCDGIYFATKRDWRLPSVAELASLVDYSKPPQGGPSVIDQALFSLVQPLDYWTSTRTNGVKGEVYVVGFSGGDILWSQESTANRVLCVRGSAKAAATDRYLVHGSGQSVLDRWTNQRWRVATLKGSWDTVGAFCSGVSLDGSGPYRLPSVRELYGLMELRAVPPLIDASAFGATPIDAWYWSGSTHAAVSDFAWRVDFTEGKVFNGQPKPSPNLSRCVTDLPSCKIDADCADDGDPCTVPSCLSSGACDHQPASGAACTLASGCPGQCDKGSCAPTGKALPAATTLELAESTTIQALSPDDAGGAALCVNGYTDQTSTTTNWLRRIDAQTKVIWQKDLGNKGLGQTCAVPAMQADGGVTALGLIGDPGKFALGFWKWDSKGSALLSAKPLGQAIYAVYGTASVDGLLALGGSHAYESGQRALFVVVDAGGAPVVSHTAYPSGASFAEVRGMALTPTGWHAAGYAQVGSGPRGVLTIASNPGGAPNAKPKRLHWADDGWYAHAAAAAPDGGTFIVVGDPGTQLLRRHDADGTLRFERALPAGVAVKKATWTPVGLLLAGRILGVKKALVARVDASGAIVWQRAEPFPTDGALLDIAWTGKEIWAVGYQFVPGGASLGYHLRLDAWGRQACSTGGCADQGIVACDDGDPCTTDRCDGESGKCSSIPYADATPCAVGKVCVAGACKASCGNGAIDDGEDCDDGGTALGDGCDAVCAWEPNAERVYIPRSTLLIGCNAVLDQQCQADELPQHQVALSPYWIDRYELTVGRYKSCALAGACANKPAGTVSLNQTTRPATHLNFADAVNACAFVVPKGRLPTEAEWELAARGSCAHHPGVDCAKAMPTYPFGNSWNGCAGAVVSGCAGPLPVGSAAVGASPFQLYDTIGNVDEWVSDWYDPDYYQVSEASDPKGPAKASNGNHVARGGSYTSAAAGVHARAAARVGHHKSVSSDSIDSLGVRCALSAAPCGDGKRDPGEDCDDGNNKGQDGCPGDCRLH